MPTEVAKRSDTFTQSVANPVNPEIHYKLPVWMWEDSAGR